MKELWRDLLWNMRNWRWWVLLPLLPAFLAIVLMSFAIEVAEEEMMRLVGWKRKNDYSEPKE